MKLKLLFLAVLALVLFAGLAGQGAAAQAPDAARLVKLAWSSDGTQIAGAKSDGTIPIWNAATGVLELTLTGHTSGATALAWNPVTPGQLASGGGDGFVRIWDTTQGELLAEFETLAPSISAVAWTSDGIRLFAFSADRDAWVWDTTTNEQVYTFQGGGYAAALSPDGKKVAALRPEGGITLIDAHTGAFLARLEGHRGKVLALDWSPDSDKLVSTGTDGTVRVWNAGRYGLLRVLAGQATGYVEDVDWSADGRWIASGDMNGTTRIWNAKTGDYLYAFVTGSALVTWSPDGSQFAYGSEDGIPLIVNLTGLPPNVK